MIDRRKNLEDFCSSILDLLISLENESQKLRATVDVTIVPSRKNAFSLPAISH